jgi:ligand-binding sensor domain-containing protein
MLLLQTLRIGFIMLCFCWVTFAANAQNLEGVSIEGTLLMLDDKTPHVACVVQVVKPTVDGRGEPTVVATTLSDESGKYQFVDLKPGWYQIRCYTSNGYVYYQDEKALHLQRGRSLSNTDCRFALFKKGTWRSYSPLDGLAHNWVNTFHCTPDGMMWFGTNGGVSRFDGKTFVNLSAQDGLAYNWVFAIHHSQDGVLWFGTSGGGVPQYDRGQFTSFTIQNGLPDNYIMTIHQDSAHALWFGTQKGGVSRYDGNGFTNFTTADGLAHNRVNAIQSDAGGILWFGTGEGISRYDGKEFVNFTTRDGLANNDVWSIHRDADGILWFGTNNGVAGYDVSVRNRVGDQNHWIRRDWQGEKAA